MEWENSASSKLNLSFLFDKPAGRDGFITVKDGHFVKPTGERFKIWGVNLAFGACFPDKTDAPKMVAYLTRFGINAVRLHFLDSEWGKDRYLFNTNQRNTSVLSADMLDKLDFFVAELKKAGVYSNINLNVGRFFREGDGVAEYQALGIAKGATLFDDRLIELQKEYAKLLLTHVNPYTGNAYANEPAIAMIEILNENSLIEAWYGGRLTLKEEKGKPGVWSNVPPYYAHELTSKYNKWLKAQLTHSDLEVISKEAGVKMGATIPRLLPSAFAKASEFRFHTEAKFIIHTERDFFTGMYNYLKNQVGVKSMIAANSDHNQFKSGYALLSNTSLLDYVDGHAYWHIYGNSTDKKTGKERYGRKDNLPMVTVPKISNPVKLARSAVEGKPFTVSEINNGSYNDYYCEGVPIIAAYAALQDWDGIFYFALAHVSPDLWNTFMPGGLDLAADPIRMANMAASGLMFLRNDLKPSESTVLRGYTENEVIEGIRDTSSIMPFFTKGFSPLIPLIQKTRIASFNRKITDYPGIKDTTQINAETGEITWHNIEDKSFIEIASAKSEALIGFLPVVTSKLKHLKVDVKNDFASITLTSLDNKPIAMAEKILLVATARAGMTGMKWTIGQTRLLEKGRRPTTIEVVNGEITLSGLINAKKVVVEPLDGGGNPLTTLLMPVKKGKVTLNLGNNVTVWYYLTVKR